MKAKIHPTWYKDAQVVCVCGNTFTVGSTKQTIRIEICHKCHPYYTGSMKYVDTLGRVEKFQKKQKEASAKIAVLEEKKKKKKEKIQEERRPKTLREMLMGAA